LFSKISTRNPELRTSIQRTPDSRLQSKTQSDPAKDSEAKVKSEDVTLEACFSFPGLTPNTQSENAGWEE
jgi:hypothetical protein